MSNRSSFNDHDKAVHFVKNIIPLKMHQSHHPLRSFDR
jgi:pterin-4a-carbinolamine dehydratase